VDQASYAFPSRAISALAITLFAMTFVLVPRGWGRDRLRVGCTAALVLVVAAELYLGADYLSAAAYALLLSPCVADVTFRWQVPEEGFPVSYRRRGSAAHLDPSGERGAAIVRAMADQLGLTVTQVEEFGLEGSGGSSPLRMTLTDGRRLFGKIYSTSHERADRWYRFGRTILYGQLEDETPVGSVRRLATYDHYALRLPGRGSVQHAAVPGPAHRPRPVYARATRVFSPRRAPGQDEGRRPPPHGAVRQLAPPRQQVSIQRWSAQRLTLTGAALLGTLLLVGLFLDSLRAGLG
jgi:hypothetical protein